MSKHLGFSYGTKDEEPIIVHLRDLQSISKVSVMIFMSGIEIRSRDGDAYTFSKFVSGNADEIVDEVIAQANLVGNTSLRRK